MNSCFVEVDHAHQSKAGQGAAGDVFLSQKIADDDRTICILADGLGSGIKANVLATLTATMAMKYVTSDIDLREASQIIMQTLPVCSERKIGYSTFTLFDIDADSLVRVIEYDNPPYILIRDGQVVEIEKEKFEIPSAGFASRYLYYSSFKPRVNDIAIVFSDGVSQSAMGSKQYPMGWRNEGVAKYCLELIHKDSGISARKLSREIVARALANDRYTAKDDISCAVVYLRRPRKTIVITGPSIDPARDSEMAAKINDYPGNKVICGGTTAKIVARELERDVEVDLDIHDINVPPTSRIEGIDLVTEGTLTLSRTCEILEKQPDIETLRPDAAVRLARMLVNSDIINFVVGTKINEAHQDPNLPAELDIRRNLIRKMVELLNVKYLKEADMKLI